MSASSLASRAGLPVVLRTRLLLDRPMVFYPSGVFPSHGLWADRGRGAQLAKTSNGWQKPLQRDSATLSIDGRESDGFQSDSFPLNETSRAEPSRQKRPIVYMVVRCEPAACGDPAEIQMTRKKYRRAHAAVAHHLARPSARFAFSAICLPACLPARPPG